MTFPHIAFLPPALLVGLALPRARDARLVTGAFLLVALAVASATLVLGDGPAAELAARAGARGVDAGYLTVNAVLLLTGFGLVAVALAGDRGESRPLRAVLVSVVLLLAVAWAWPLVAAARLAVAIPAAIAAVLLLLAFAVWAGGVGAEAGSTLADWAGRGWRAGTFAWGVASAAVLGVLAPGFGAGLALAAIALGLAWFAGPARRGPERLPVVPLASVVVAAIAALAWRAAGSDGLAYAGIADAAFSPRLQGLLAAALLPALFVLAGVPPFDRVMPGAALAPLAAVLVARGVVPGFAEGVAQWVSLAAIWLVVAAMDGLRRERSGAVMACASLFVLLVGGEPAMEAGLLLGALAAAFELGPLVARRVPRGVGRAAFALALAAWAVGLGAALEQEVVYSVALSAVLLGGALRGAGRPAEAPAALA